MTSAAYTVWLTGLPGAGKTTLAKALAERLLRQGLELEVFSSRRLPPEVSYVPMSWSPEARRDRSQIIAEACRRRMAQGKICLVEGSWPSRADREDARLRIGELVEIHVSTPLEVCQDRASHVYARASTPELKRDWHEVPGMGMTYEAPEFPELSLDLSFLSTDDAVEQVLALLKSLDYPVERQQAMGLSPEEAEAKVRARLEALGYV